MRRYELIVPVEADSEDEAWAAFWELVVRGAGDHWADVPVVIRRVGSHAIRTDHES